MTINLDQDLRNRWTPTLEQSQAAYDELTRIARTDPHADVDVITIHLLANKRRSWWTEDVQVKPLPGIYHSRNDALAALEVAAAAIRAVWRGHFTTGWTYHHLPREDEDTRGHATGWAVFEDILAVSDDND